VRYKEVIFSVTSTGLHTSLKCGRSCVQALVVSNQRWWNWYLLQGCHLIKCNLFLQWYSWTIAHLALLNNNHSLSHYIKVCLGFVLLLGLMNVFFYLAECSMPIEVSIFICFINYVLSFES